MLLRTTSFSLVLLVACQPARSSEPPPAGSALGIRGVDMSKIDLGIFNSDILKISWFRFADLVAGNPKDDPQGFRLTEAKLSWEPQWFGIFSHGWLRERGYRANEKYLTYQDSKTKKVLSVFPTLKMYFNDMGFPNADVRQMVAYLMTKAHLMELPDIDPELLTKEWFDRFQKMPPIPESWNREVGFVKILVVESDKGRRVMLHYTFRDNPGLLAKSRILHTEAARLMANYAPDAAGMRVDSEK